jgi:hypothetical protein
VLAARFQARRVSLTNAAAVAGGGLGVPDREVADQLGLGGGRVRPVDRAPLRGVDRAAAAEQEQRHAVAEGVVDGHGGVHEADEVVDRRDADLPGALGVAVGQGDGDLLVQAEQQLRVDVAPVVDQGVVQAAERGARVQRHVLRAQGPQQVDHEVAAVLGRPGDHPRRPLDVVRALLVHRRQPLVWERLPDGSRGQAVPGRDRLSSCVVSR